ncbi:MAG: BON domain-containing protein [Pirellulales bacterium]
MAESFDESPSESNNSARSFEQRVHELLSQHPHFRGRACNFKYEYREDLLIVRGCVPSFYLKQILQTVLKDVDGVTHIDNQVDVISSFGVSSVRGITR